MKIDHCVETPDGKRVSFMGELANEELEVVLKIGLNVLLHHNMLPFTRATESLIIPDNMEQQ